MIYLVLSLISSSAIFLLFKWFGVKGVNTLQAIVVNYFVASIFGLILLSGQVSLNDLSFSPVIRNGILLGFLFIGLFFLMALISQKMGAGISSTATKLSLVIPTLFFILINENEEFSWLKILALVLSIPGVILTVYQPSKERKLSILLPLILFVGSGILDITLAYTEQNFAQTDVEKILLTMTPFTVSGFVGVLFLIFAKSNSIKISRRSFFYGLILGLVNFGSIFYLLKTFEMIGLEKSQIIPINNLGIVVLSALAAYLLLQEKLSKTNFIGLLISIMAIYLLIIDSF